MVNADAPLAVLKSPFGYDRFRPLQADIVGNVNFSPPTSEFKG